MRKLSKKISMLMVLAMLVGLFSGVVSASAASAWSFASGKYDVAVNGSINMESKEYADFDLLKDGKAPAGYTVAWASSDEDVVWVNAKTGQLRANKFGKAADGDKAVISATFTNTATKKSATRSFTIVLGAAKADFTVEAADVTIALGEEVKFAPVVKDAAGNVVKFATHKSYNGYFLDGKAIANPWTPEEAGEYTVTVAQFAKKADVADLAKAVRKDEVKVTVTVDAAFDAKATGVKEITVYGDFAKDAAITVKKGTGIKVAATVTIAEDGKSAKLALKNRITKGVYTVSCGDDSVSITCEDERPDKIIIEEKGGVVAVGNNRTEAYAHYDVLNQYGESIRKTANVQITTSTDKDSVPDKATGRIIISTSQDAGFIYGSQIVLNISAVGYAAFESAILTAGLEDSVDTVKVAGITLADSGKILDEAPVSFLGAKDEVKFYLLFQMLDRSGHVMKVENVADAQENLFFASLNPMLIKGFGEITTKRIDGVEYLAIELEPGMQLKKGGVADIEIRSNKTGGATPYALRVVSDQILSQFNILPYDDVIVKDRPNDDWPGRATIVDLAFEAIDTNGELITDFRALYDKVYFSESNVKLAEQNDGSAKLTYTVPQDDPAMNPTKDFDVPVVINAIVPEGKGNTITLYVKEARYANTVDGYYGNNTVLEGHSLKIDLGSNAGHLDRVQVADQYDDVLKEVDYFKGDANNKRAKKFGVKVIGDNVTGLKVADEETRATTEDGYFIFNPSEDLLLEALESVTDTTASFVVEFVLLDVNNKVLSGTSKTATFYVADISQATGFAITECDTLIKNDSDSTTVKITAYFATGGKQELKNNTGDTEKYSITYSSNAWVYAGSEASQLSAATGASATIAPAYYEGKDVGPLKYASQFDNVAVLNPDGTYGSRTVPVEVTATIKIGSENEGAYDNYQLRDTLKTTIQVGAYAKRWAEFVLAGHIGNPNATVTAWDGNIDHGNLISVIDKIKNNYADTLNSWENWDLNWHFPNTRALTKVTISNLKENLETGLKYGNLKLVNNVNNTLITGAEMGDTFTATYELDDAKLVLNFTVGADGNAYIQGARKAENVNWY